MNFEDLKRDCPARYNDYDCRMNGGICDRDDCILRHLPVKCQAITIDWNMNNKEGDKK